MNTPAWLPALDIAWGVLNWSVCLWVGFNFGWQYGAVLFVLFEVRAMLAFALGRKKERRILYD